MPHQSMSRYFHLLVLMRLDPPAQIRLLGKGRKMRAVPLMANTVQLLRSHMQENHLDHPEQFDKPLFHNARHERLTRSGIRYILHKYVVLARRKCPSLNRTVSPHTLRHTKGMHLLQSGVSLDMIRDFLGHVDAKTTQIYARANLEMKRNALEKISEPSLVQTIPCWQQNKDLLTGSIPCNPSSGHASMATATRPPPVNRGYYAESTQACPLTTGDLGHPLHMSTFRT